MKTDRELLKELTGWLDRANLSIRSDLNQFRDWYGRWRKTKFEQPAEVEETAQQPTSQETESLPPADSKDEVSNPAASGAPDESLHDSNPAEAENGADSESGQTDQPTPPVDNPGSQ